MTSRLPIIPARDSAECAIVPPPAEAAGSPQRPDLRDQDLFDVLVAFYVSVAKEPILAAYFERVDMPAHLPRIVDFWSTLLFHTGRYSGNAFAPHLDMPGLTPNHFGRWLATLERTVDDAHAGPNAERMKALGHRVAYSMQLRLGLTPVVAYRPDLS